MAITQQELKELVEYREDGTLVWKTDRNNGIKAGAVLGANSIGTGGYRKTKILGVYYRVHRLVFLYFHGFYPTFTDHIDGNPGNNRIENLRDATNSQNQGNRPKVRDNRSGFKGVRKPRGCTRWQASLNSRYLGSFLTPIEAAKAYDEAAKQYYGPFAKLNFPQPQ